MSAREFYPRAANAETPFAAADADLGAKRSQRWLPGRATLLVRLDSERIAVRFHRANVVVYHASGAVEVSTGGYRGHDDGQGSVTTKARIKSYAPGMSNLWQHDKRWHVRLDGYERSLPFVDGMALYPDGTLVYPGEDHVVAVARRVAPPPPPPPRRVRRRRNRDVATLPLAFTRVGASAIALAR